MKIEFITAHWPYVFEDEIPAKFYLIMMYLSWISHSDTQISYVGLPSILYWWTLRFSSASQV